MFIEKAKTATPKEELYKVGNVIKYGSRVHLVIELGGGTKYALLDLTNDTVCSRIHDTLEDLADECYSEGMDELVTAKVVIEED